MAVSYKISAGLPESKLAEWLEEAAQRFDSFDDGRVNYTDAKIAPIVMCAVVCGNEILLVKRGFGLADAEGYWSIVSGFIDEVKLVKKQAQQEVKEELGLNLNIKDIKVGQSYTLNNPKEKRSYIVFPCLVSLATKPEIILDREHTDYVWIQRAELNAYETLDDLPYAIDTALKLRD